MPEINDLDLFEEIKTRAQALKMAHSARDSAFGRYEDLYLMRWDEEAEIRRQAEQLKLTLSPSARNSIVGAARLMIATDPEFSVPFEKNDKDAKRVSEKLEKFARLMWLAGGRQVGDPIHYDVVRSALIFSEVHIAITSTRQLLEQAQGSSKGRQRRLKALAERTPYIFQAWNPKNGYPEWDVAGLCSYYRQVDMSGHAVVRNWGDKARAVFAERDGKIPESVILNAWYDDDHYIVWLDGYKKVLHMEAHGLPFIPVEAQLVDGSRLFDKPEEQREPFIFTLERSKLWQRQNLMLTVMHTLAFAIGANPQLVYEALDPNAELDLDFSVPGGVIKIQRGEQLHQLVKQIIDPSLLTLWGVDTDLEAQSTIYKQTLGEPLGSNAPYSMVALLSQTGRLPLVVPQRKSGWAMGGALQKAFAWMKESGRKSTARYHYRMAEIAPEDIPDYFEIAATLEIALPQDKLTLANIARQISEGEQPLASRRWTRENILQVGASGEMDREILKEKAKDIMARRWLAQQMAQIAMAEQAAIQPGAAGGMPGGQPVPASPFEAGPPSPPQPMPPEVMREQPMPPIPGPPAPTGVMEEG